jgi:IS5 family transposase
MLRLDKQLTLSEYSDLYDVVVPKDNILRKISELIDFSFVNEMLRKSYCETFGRPAKEPEMMFKIMFLKRMYDLSDELLVGELGYNMAYKYFVGLNPEDKTIDSSLLTKFRKTRITEDILEEMITETMRQAIAKGLVKSRAIIVDSTHSYSKGNPETPTQILRRMTKTLRKEIYKTQPELAECFPEKPSETAMIEDEIEYAILLAAALKDKLSYKATQKLLKRVEELLADDKIKSIQSPNDEDASVGHKSIDNSFFGYKNHLAITDERLISGITVTSGRAADSKELESLVEKSEGNGVIVEEVLGDMAYSSKDNIDYCEDKNIKLVSRLNTVVSNGNSRDAEFIFNKDAGTLQCPEGHLAMRCEIREGNYDNQYYNYFFSIKKCKKCPRYGTCCKKGAKYKCHNVTIMGKTREKQYEFEQSEYFKERIKERYKIEAKNAELKQSHGLSRCKYVGLFGMKTQIYFTAFVANVKRIVKLTELATA